MASGFVIRKSQYYDSVFLMRIASTLNDVPGVSQSAAVMATDANKELLAEIGISGGALIGANPNDLVVAVIAQDPAVVETVLATIDERLLNGSSTIKSTRFRSIDEASVSNPDSNLVVISVPGTYAAREARKALEQGKHVFIFSDNVPVEQEAEIKQLAREQGRLVMGPDCGTSLIGGVGIGFANQVRRGSIGAVGASGTGLQEFTSLVHQAGAGISHAIGTGSHDLSDAVGGITTLIGLDALEADPATRVIAIVSKPAGSGTLQRLFDRVRICSKPVVGCFLGLERQLQDLGPHFHQALTIDEAVEFAVTLSMIESGKGVTERRERPQSTIQEEISGWREKQRYLRGLFAGGTFCYQTQQVLRDAGLAVYSNAPLDKRFKLENPEISLEHSMVDLGEDYFTQGTPHPMIDATQRRKRILKEAEDPEVGVLLLDFILGHIASPDPVGDLIEAIQTAKGMAVRRGGRLTVVASICGTDQDPQGLGRQKRLLDQAGVLVFPSNYQAARFCSDLLLELPGGKHGK